MPFMKAAVQRKILLSTKKHLNSMLWQQMQDAEALDGGPCNFQNATGTQTEPAMCLGKPEDISEAHTTWPHVKQSTIKVIFI